MSRRTRKDSTSGKENVTGSLVEDKHSLNRPNLVFCCFSSTYNYGTVS